MFALRSDENVRRTERYRMFFWRHCYPPEVVVIIRLLDAGKRHSTKYLNTKDQSSLKQDALEPPKGIKMSIKVLDMIKVFKGT